MIDIKRIIESTQEVKDGLSKRMSDVDAKLDSIISIYTQKREKQKEYEAFRSQQNSFNDTMAKLDKSSEEFKNTITNLKEVASKVKQIEDQVRELDAQLEEQLLALPNVPDADVVAGEKEANQVVKEVGKPPVFEFEVKDHLDVGLSLGLLDMDRATKLGGNGFAMYTGYGARLEWALLNYFIDEHTKDGFKMILPPHLLTEESGYGAGQLPKFRDDVYWVQDGNFLLPTAESALANLYRGEVLDLNALPIKLFAYSPCYRREAGSYRANERGLLRMHQFNKVEMFAYTTPEQSEGMLEELVRKAERLVEGLGLHYRTVKLAAGDCSAGAAKTYDVEVWLPYLKTYYEVSSCSNVREYQSRRSNIKFKSGTGENRYVHMLNASGLATSRLMVALLETYQNADSSLTVPEVLRKYVGTDIIR